MARLIRDHKQPLALALAMLSIGFGLATLSPARAAGSGQKWAYHCEEVAKGKGTAGLDEGMNAKGAEGWELVSSNVIPKGMTYRLLTCYKKPL